MCRLSINLNLNQKQGNGNVSHVCCCVIGIHSFTPILFLVPYFFHNILSCLVDGMVEMRAGPTFAVSKQSWLFYL